MDAQKLEWKRYNSLGNYEEKANFLVLGSSMEEFANIRLEMDTSWPGFGQAGHSQEKQSPTETCRDACTGPREKQSYCHGGRR